MTERSVRTFTIADAAIRLAIVGLVLGTAYIHSTLGGMLFTLNALGYLVAAAAIVAPIAIASRYRWFIRIGLMGYAATAIVGLGRPGPVLFDRLSRQGHRDRPHHAARRRLRPLRRQPAGGGSARDRGWSGRTSRLGGRLRPQPERQES